MVVKVSREIAELISSEVIEYGGPENFLKVHSNINNQWKGHLRALNEITIWEMAQALINGYEIEETPEERIKKVYLLRKGDSINMDDTWSKAFVRAIDFLLEELDIKIEGIND